jgi:heptosyltransferase-2
VYARWLRPKPVPPLLQTYRELAGLDPGSELTPWLLDALSETERARGLERVGRASRARGFILLGAGARWGTKRWPAAHFVRLAERIERERGLGARFALLPGEPVAPEIERHLASRGEVLLSLPFRELAAAASHALAIVSNDSAVLHLGPALGVPAVGVFGGTVPEFGFARQGPRDEVAETRLWCRPCGVHGRSRCPLGHHACMRDLAPDLAYAALSRALDGRAAA